MSTDNVAFPITTNSKRIAVTPTLDTSAYASGDRVGTVMTLTNCCRRAGFGAVLQNVVVIDQAKQSVALDILFFKNSPTVASADNAAIDITDAQMIANCVGHVSVAAADYSALAGSSVASPAPFNRLMLPEDESTTLYALLVCRSGTPTYAAGSLVIHFNFLQD